MQQASPAGAVLWTSVYGAWLRAGWSVYGPELQTWPLTCTSDGIHTIVDADQTNLVLSKLFERCVGDVGILVGNHFVVFEIYFEVELRNEILKTDIVFAGLQ